MKHCGTQTLETGRLLLRRVIGSFCPGLARAFAVPTRLPLAPRPRHVL